MAVIYASSTLALSALEYLVHLDIEDVPDDLVALEIEVPGEAPAVDVQTADLSPDWNVVAEHPVCIALGDQWIEQGETLVLRVPSAVIPTEQNILLNPRHSDMDGVRIVASWDFAFDRRLL